MFQRSIRFYDAIYSGKDYATEVARLREFIQASNPDARTLLDVACGTGKHLEHLRLHYEVEGLDLEPGFSALARERLPGVPIHEGDMRDFVLGKKFDVVTCLFSSVAYMTNMHDLASSIKTMAAHLAERGLLIVEPFFSPGQFEAGRPWSLFVDEPDVKIARLDVPQVEGTVGIVPFHYLVATSEGVEHFTELHRLGLFTHDEYEDAFEGAGLTATHDARGLMGRGLYMAQRQTA